MQSCPVCLRANISTGESRDARLVACGTCGVYLFAPEAAFALSTLSNSQRDGLSAYLRRHQAEERVRIDTRNFLQLATEGAHGGGLKRI